MNYHYWFDYFEVSLTKKKHSFDNLMITSQCFIEILPHIVKKYNICDKRYLSELYTKCGINQIFTAFINSFLLKDDIKLFQMRYKKIMKHKDIISKYYEPNELEYRISKIIMLSFNWKLVKFYFFLLSIYLKIRTKMSRTLKKTIIRIYYK